ncbi:GR25 family glycosyltransferase involved in LPS biosynthesis [Pseudochelatococcus lubricantis]|uniref:GR25 family glycosyltransferase involved in LPS biosynthesis n=1 Tax=Pseudochelatococcus lubricantis TaxID=1538102 RepID=A0ABX0V3R6_9HYPH|nr:glycosyltransferase family 25 protein [Pseudochelatococcus lubricantis]NIJ58734.1 GR25 family glycosyltransferase involved in LPS biosynthesis [Pseudochelatococcus lubricantis]
MLETYVITIRGSDRESWISNHLSRFSDVLKVNFISQDAGIDLNPIELAVNGYIKLFPSHWVSEKLYDYSALQYKMGTLGCMMGHYLANSRAAESGHAFSLVLEDNIELVSNFSQEISRVLDSIKGNEFDIIHLYSARSDEREIFKENIRYGVDEWSTAKAQIVSRRFSNFVASNIPFHQVADGVTMLPSVKWVPIGMKSFIVQPFLVKINENFKSTRKKQDKQERKYSIVYKRVPKSISSFVAGAKHSNGDEIFSYNGNMYTISFEVGNAKYVNGEYIFSKILGKRGIQDENIRKKLMAMTPEEFISAGETFYIRFYNGDKIDNSVSIITKKDLIFPIGNDEYLFFFIRENVLPEMVGDYIHRYLTPAYTYLNI